MEREQLFILVHMGWTKEYDSSTSAATTQRSTN